MPTDDSFQGVSNCYVFKSRLQEYAQKVGVPTPVYDTIKEGPAHEPFFKSSVIVNDIRYDSLPGFSNRKAAEQSAAEVALMELAKSGDVDQCISQPVHETGLCKNLLQEYAQKMNYAIPLYQCQPDEAPGRATLFKCTIEIGGIRYIGASAKNKKEAEIKAARTALLAIQFASEYASKPIETAQLTVLPCKKRPADPIVDNLEEPPAPKKAKRGRLKKKSRKATFRGVRKNTNQTCVENPSKLDQNTDRVRERLAAESLPKPQDGLNQSDRERAVFENPSVSHEHLLPMPCGDTAPVAKDGLKSGSSVEKLSYAEI